jgi:hypothetical protein
MIPENPDLKPEDVEPGDRSEQFSPLDWCLAAGCGCSGCMDPTGCMDAMTQGCVGCIHSCLVRLGCSVFVLGGIIGLIILAVTAV